MESLNLEYLKNLSYQQKIEFEAKIVGYEKLPPSIEEFIEDPFYLGSIYGKGMLYPYWKPILNDLFPTPIHTRYNNIVLSGCLGSGKSTISRVIMLYQECRLDHLKDFNFFGIARGKALVHSYFHTTGDNVDNTFLAPLRDVYRNQSPYFREGLLHPERRIENKPDTPRGRGPIGLDVIGYTLSEANFVAPDRMEQKLNTAMNRLSSRFLKVRDYFGLIIIDSSAAGNGNFVDNYIDEKCDPNTTLIVKAKIWEVKSHQGTYFQMTDHPLGNSFEVYLGDARYDPFIIEEWEKERDLPLDLDVDRLLVVPRELYKAFQLDLFLSLQDHAGISASTSDLFIQDRESIMRSMVLPKISKEMILVDFYDRSAKLIDFLRSELNTIPPEKVLAIRIDLGLVSDYCGLSIGYFDEWIVKDQKNKTKIPTFKFPIAIAIGRREGQETSISHIYEMIKDISKEFTIGVISTDQFQSKGLLQDLERDGFHTRLISVDRTPDAYQALKLAMYEGRVQISQSRLLTRELRELKITMKGSRMKVDHPVLTSSDAMTQGRGSKDIADALAGNIQAMLDELELFTVLSKMYTSRRLTQHYHDLGNINKNNINKLFKDSFKRGGIEMVKNQHFTDLGQIRGKRGELPLTRAAAGGRFGRLD